MPNPNLSPTRNKSIAFIDYKPAELRTNKDWIIVYYIKPPFQDKLERQRLRVPTMRNKTERLRHANRIVAEINRKLAEGWNPYLENPGKSFALLADCISKFTENIEKEIKDGIKRADTLRSYKSYLSMIQTYIAVKNQPIKFSIEFNKEFVVNYLDWIYYERGNSPTTFNNHLLFLNNFSNFMISRGYLKDSPTTGIVKKKELRKKRQVISPKIKRIINREMPQWDSRFFTLCMATYYCLLRRTELTKLKVKDVNLFTNVITIPGDVGKKNGLDETVTIPAEYKNMLAVHIADADPNDYIFAGKFFKPGSVQLKPKRISDTWTKFQGIFGIPDYVQFYSFKDTGIEDLFNRGVSPLKIRDQARHSDLKITERYTSRATTAIPDIIHSGAFF